MSDSATVRMQITGMNCASCVRRVEAALRGVTGVVAASVNLADESAQISYDAPADPATLAAALRAAGYPPLVQSAELDIAGLSCASCVRRVETALQAVPGVIAARVNLASETAAVEYSAGLATLSDIAAAATAAGYKATARSTQPATDRKQAEAEVLWRATLLAAALALPVFVLEMGAHVIPGMHHWIGQVIGHQTSRLLQFLLTTLVLIGPGRGFYTKGLPLLARGAPDMNALVAVGTLAAYGYSVVATFAPAVLPEQARNVYYEAAAVIVVLILLGRFLEARAKGRSGAAIAGLIGLRPKTAQLLRAGQLSEIAVDDIAVGDILRLRPGERVAVDGEVTEGTSYLDESMISGEPVPVEKAKGAALVGGTVNGAGALSYRATKVGHDTVLAQIIRMVEQAQGAKLPIQAVVDRITAWFVPAVIATAILTVVIWLLLGPDPALTHALVAGVAVLIIACPCAMGLATPTSIMVGTGRAAELGVLFRKGDALQALQGVQIVAVDKTGTLTQGRPELTDIMLADGFDAAKVLAMAAALEARSEHPIAQAIMRAADARDLALPAIDDFASVTGYGVAAVIDGARVIVGADRFMTREGVDAGPLLEQGADLAGRGRTPLYVAIDGRIAALIGVADPVKPTSRAAIEALHALGLRVAMITGDHRATAQAIATELGIDELRAEVLPDGKVAALHDLARDGMKIAFVGDGINDAPALAAADVGIAIGTGTDIAIETADVVLMSGDLMGVVNALRISRRTMANIRQNLFWAFGYNVALIPVAAGALYPVSGVLLSPILAAGAMALSSVFVLSNALRLRWVRPVVSHIDKT